jgi:hypothetical protein
MVKREAIEREVWKHRCQREAITTSQRIYLVREAEDYRLIPVADYRRLQRQEEVIGTGLPDGDWREGK